MSSQGCRIGIDLGGTKIEAVVLDSSGQVLVQERRTTPRNYAGTLRILKEIVGDLEMRAEQSCSVGIGAPGAVSPATGRMKNCNSTWLNGMPFKEDLETALEREIRLANDADCFVLSEAVDGAGRNADSVFGVILGTGVGGAIVVHQKVLSGPNAITGEWGHNPMPWPMDDEWPGPPCYCSRTGCIETLLSGPGLSAHYDGGTTPAEEIVQRAARGESKAEAALAVYCDRLARALASVINLLDPQIIVLGGGLSQISELYKAVPMLWGAYVFSDRVDTQLSPPEHGDAGGVRGAAWLWGRPAP